MEQVIYYFQENIFEYVNGSHNVNKNSKGSDPFSVSDLLKFTLSVRLL